MVWVGLHFGSKNVGRISIIFEKLSFFEPSGARVVYGILLLLWGSVSALLAMLFFFVINRRVLSANRVDFELFCFIYFPIVLRENNECQLIVQIRGLRGPEEGRERGEVHKEAEEIT